MKKLLITAVLMGSLIAASVDVITPRDMSLATMRLLEQNLAEKQGISPFNSDFKWDELKDESVVIASLKRLKDPSIYRMLGIWKHSATLDELSIKTIDLLNQDLKLCKPDRKKEHVKEIIRNLDDLWQHVLFS